MAHSKVITVNDDSGRRCCTEEGCIDICASLSVALRYIESNTVINITSISASLQENVDLGSGGLINITISGSNSGSVYCESCDHVSIERITWDRVVILMELSLQE